MAKYLKKDERKKQIKDAAIVLMTKKGYRKTTVQDIVEKANFSKGGFYNCYSSKEEMFADIMSDLEKFRFQKINEFRDDNEQMDRDTFILEVLINKIIDYNNYKRLFSVLCNEISNNEEFYHIYKKNELEMTKSFRDFCIREGYEEYLKLMNDEFSIFINSLVLGVDAFNMYENDKYRSFLRTVIGLYFDDINIFDK